MANFLIRVELHRAVGDEYTELHAAMEKANYSRQITSGDGPPFNLPSAMYVFVGEGETKFIREEVLAIARQIKSKPDPWVIVVEFLNHSWWLQKHK